MRIKRTFKLLVAWVVGIGVSTLLVVAFDALDISTQSYGYSPNWSTEELELSENMTFAGLYSVLIGILLGMKTYWMLTEKVPGYKDIDKIKFKIGWWYFLIGSTIWALIIYLLKLINIKPIFIAGIIDAVLTVSVVYFLYKYFLVKIKSINTEIDQNNAIKDAQEADIQKTKEIIVLHMNAERSKKIKEIVDKALNEILGLLDEIQGNIHFIYKEISNVDLPKDNESVMELEGEISSALNNFNTSISWDVKKEIQEAKYALQKSSVDQVHNDEWLDREIFSSIDLTISYMQSDFMNLDKVVKKLEDYKSVDGCSLLRVLVIESVTNMLVANNKINERRKLLFDEINSIK